MSKLPLMVTLKRAGQEEKYVRLEAAEERTFELESRVLDLEEIAELAYREGFNDGYDDDARPQDAASGWLQSDARRLLSPFTVSWS